MRALVVARWKRKRNIAILRRLILILLLLLLVVLLMMLRLLIVSRVCSHARLPVGARVVRGCVGAAITRVSAGDSACLVADTLALAFAACALVTRAAATIFTLVILLV